MSVTFCTHTFLSQVLKEARKRRGRLRGSLQRWVSEEHILRQRREIWLMGGLLSAGHNHIPSEHFKSAFQAIFRAYTRSFCHNRTLICLSPRTSSVMKCSYSLRTVTIEFYLLPVAQKEELLKLVWRYGSFLSLPKIDHNHFKLAVSPLKSFKPLMITFRYTCQPQGAVCVTELWLPEWRIPVTQNFDWMWGERGLLDIVLVVLFI